MLHRPVSLSELSDLLGHSCYAAGPTTTEMRSTSSAHDQYLGYVYTLPVRPHTSAKLDTADVRQTSVVTFDCERSYLKL